MFAYPLLPSLPSSLRPATLIAPIRNMLSVPTTIDYNSIPAVSNDINGKPTSMSHSGPLADLPEDICPICHLRSNTTPVPLAAGVSLPPVGHRDDAEDDENKVFVPAQTDCWGGCRWCYYCIMGELAAIRQTQHADGNGKGSEGSQKPPKWDCLRCGGAVTGAWRVGPDPLPKESVKDIPAEAPNGHMDDHT